MIGSRSSCPLIHLNRQTVTTQDLFRFFERLLSDRASGRRHIGSQALAQLAGAGRPFNPQSLSRFARALGSLTGRRLDLRGRSLREILGTPLMVSVFHGDRWEYVFTLKRPGVEAQTRKLTVFFKDNVMDHVEGDEMPSESEFVASLTSKVSKPKVPQLEATDAQLARFPKAESAAPGPSPAPAAPPVASYPPLESPRR